MTDTLPSVPAPDGNVTRASKPNMQVANFGDGYSQRATFGMKQTAIQLTLTYSTVLTSEKDILSDFVNAHQNGEAFFFTLPDESVARVWYFTDWKFTYVSAGVFNCNLMMQECFDIVSAP